MSFMGEIIQGKWDETQQELTVLSVKNVPTQSVWNTAEIENMYMQTEKAIQANQEAIIITIRDSIPFMLNRQELSQLHREMTELRSRLL